MGHKRLFEGLYDKDPAYPHSAPRALAGRTYEIRSISCVRQHAPWGKESEVNKDGLLQLYIDKWEIPVGGRVKRGDVVAVSVYDSGLRSGSVHIKYFLSPFTGILREIYVNEGEGHTPYQKLGLIEYDLSVEQNRNPLATPLAPDLNPGWIPDNLHTCMLYAYRDVPERKAEIERKKREKEEFWRQRKIQRDQEEAEKKRQEEDERRAREERDQFVRRYTRHAPLFGALVVVLIAASIALTISLIYRHVNLVTAICASVGWLIVCVNHAKDVVVAGHDFGKRILAGLGKAKYDEQRD